MEIPARRGPQMALSISILRATKPRAKAYKLADEKGLYLLVQPSGGMLWRMKYRVDGRDEAGNPKRVEKKLGLGIYPDVSLKEARERRDEARKELANGFDPAERKRQVARASKISAANTFSSVAEAFIAKNERDGFPCVAGWKRCRWPQQ